MVSPHRYYRSPPPKIKGYKILPLVQEELYYSQSHIPGIKGLVNEKNRENSRRSKDKSYTHNRKIQREIQAPEIPPAKK